MDIFLNTCVVCNKRILASKNLFCLECNGLLPRTSFNFSKTNIVSNKLSPFIRLQAAGAFLYYNQNEMVKQILWEMKYNNHQDLALEMGRLAVSGQEKNFQESIDIIVPIPLHKSKMRLRGYNQAAHFASGLQELTNIPMSTDILFRAKQTTSQTQLDRQHRFQNLEDAFATKDLDTIRGKRVLLVDDVVTTGATLVSAGLCILNADCASLSVYTMASAFEL